MKEATQQMRQTTVQGSTFREDLMMQNRLTAVKTNSARDVSFVKNKKESGDYQQYNETQIPYIDESGVNSSDQCIKGNLERISTEIYDNQKIESTDSSVCTQVCAMLTFSLSMVIFAFQTMLIKISVSKFGISAYELTYYYAIVSLVYMAINMKLHKKDLTSIPRSSYAVVVKRVFFGVITDVFINLSFQYTSYSKSMCILFLNTIMIPFVACCLLGDKVRKLDIIAISFAFVGMFLIIQPFGNHSDTKDYRSDLIGVFIAFLSAVGSSFAVVYNKRLADTLHFTQVNFSYMIFSCLICPVFSFFAQRDTYPVYSWELFFYVLAIGTCFFVMMALMTVSIKRLKASVSGILLYIAVPTSYLFDWAFLHTPIGGLEILGAAIIVGTNIGVAIIEASGRAK